MLRRSTIVTVFIAADLLFAVPADSARADDVLRPRAAVVKPARVAVRPWHRTDVLVVKFADDAMVRLRGGLLSDLGTGELVGARAALDLDALGTWSRACSDVEEEKLSTLRRTAQRTLGRAIADFNVQYHLAVADGLDGRAVCDALNALDIVELATPAAQGPPAPLPWDMRGEQGYLNAGPGGVGAYDVWQWFGPRGAGIDVGVIDYNFNNTHQDLPTVTITGPPPPISFDENHGTASIGVLASLDNGWGTVGMAPDATYYYAAAEPSGVWNVAGAITQMLTVLGPGDVLLIEQQWFGPNYTGFPIGTQNGLVAVSWHPAVYNAILTAVGNGVTVIEPAGNGAENLDTNAYLFDDPGTPEVESHRPFILANDTGSIMVGAGAAPNIFFGSDVNTSRLPISNYGSTLDLQGWGQGVVTPGYGDLFSFEGSDRFYTNTFGGTSGASAMVAGAATLVQSAHLDANATVFTPGGLRALLIASAEPQQTGTFPSTQNIGPRPDAAMSLSAVLGTCIATWDTTVGNAGLAGAPPWGTTQVNASLVFDDGSGDQLYVGGLFESAGGSAAKSVARYDGTTWTAVGTEIVGGPVHAMATFDDGGGRELYAGGSHLFDGGMAGVPNPLIRWDGSNWNPVLGIGTAGENPIVTVMASYDDGNGEALYLGGLFDNAGGATANGIVKWDGTSWTDIGGLTLFGGPGNVDAMLVYDDGTGPALFVGGTFNDAGGVSVNSVAKWDGTTWSAVGAGTNNSVYALTSWNDGTGMKLYAGGNFTTYAGVTARGVAAWDGTTWSGIPGPGVESPTQVSSFGVFHDGSSESLIVGGTFARAGAVWANSIVKFDGTDWWPLGDGFQPGLSVETLTVYDDGTGKGLYAAGRLPVVFDLPVDNIAKWQRCPVPCPSDLDGNGTVGFVDLNLLLGQWGLCAACPEDLDGDGNVGFVDLNIMLAAWGPCP